MGTADVEGEGGQHQRGRSVTEDSNDSDVRTTRATKQAKSGAGAAPQAE